MEEGAEEGKSQWGCAERCCLGTAQLLLPYTHGVMVAMIVCIRSSHRG